MYKKFAIVLVLALFLLVRAPRARALSQSTQLGPDESLIRVVNLAFDVTTPLDVYILQPDSALPEKPTADQFIPSMSPPSVSGYRKVSGVPMGGFGREIRVLDSGTKKLRLQKIISVTPGSVQTFVLLSPNPNEKGLRMQLLNDSPDPATEGRKVIVSNLPDKSIPVSITSATALKIDGSIPVRLQASTYEYKVYANYIDMYNDPMLEKENDFPSCLVKLGKEGYLVVTATPTLSSTNGNDHFFPNRQQSQGMQIPLNLIAVKIISG